MNNNNETNFRQGVKTYPDLNVAALEQKAAKYIRVWYIARHLDHPGHGWVLVERLKRFMLDNEIMSRETLRQTLKAGDGTWWEVVSHKKGDRLYLNGLRKICRYLGVDRLRKSPVLLSLEVFRKIGDFKAHVYATLFNGNDRPMSRQTINQITGVSNRSQRNYEKRARVETTQNWSRSRLPHRLSKEALGQGEYQRYEKGTWYLYKRLPDTRTSNYLVARRGMLRRLNRMLRRAVDEIVEYAKARARFSIEGKPAVFRRYFNNPKTLLKAKNRLDVVFLRTGSHKDMVLWQPVYIE